MADGSRVQPPSQDQQRFSRAAIICTARLELGDRTLACDVCDISAGGAKVSLAETPAEGIAVELQFDDEIAFTGRVVWARDGQAGIEFADAPELVAEVLPRILEGPAREREKRAFLRSAVLWSGEVAHGEQSIPCRILNVSAGGAKVRVDQELAPGSEIRLSCSRFAEMPARVVWWHDGKMGVRFLAEPEQVTKFVAHALAPFRDLG